MGLWEHLTVGPLLASVSPCWVLFDPVGPKLAPAVHYWPFLVHDSTCLSLSGPVTFGPVGPFLAPFGSLWLIILILDSFEPFSTLLCLLFVKIPQQWPIPTTKIFKLSFKRPQKFMKSLN